MFPLLSYALGAAEIGFSRAHGCIASHWTAEGGSMNNKCTCCTCQLCAGGNEESA